MNTSRKFQLGALAVLANGALALALLSPGEAFANPCGISQDCYGGGTCPSMQAQINACNAAAPLCITITTSCSIVDTFECVGAQITCYYRNR
jgi:hypothetical protein